MILAFMTFPLSAAAQMVGTDVPKGKLYQTSYYFSGFLLRSSSVCGGDWKHSVEVALRLISSDELRRIGKAYPDTTKQWASEGAANFNTGVMQSGIQEACRFALTVRSKLEDQLNRKGGTKG
jgi:hypothetical protein